MACKMCAPLSCKGNELKLAKKCREEQKKLTEHKDSSLEQHVQLLPLDNELFVSVLSLR